MGEDVIKEKQCYVCKEFKTLDLFGKNVRGKDGLTSRCKGCSKLYREAHREQKRLSDRRYYRENPEKFAKYRLDHKEERSEYMKGWREENKEKISIYSAQWREEHVEERRIYMQQWERDHKEERNQYYQDNKDHFVDYRVKYYQENKYKILVKRAIYRKNKKELYSQIAKNYVKTEMGKYVRAEGGKRRKERMKIAEGSHTRQDVMDQGEKQGWMCYWKGTNCTGYCKEDFNKDHKVPLCRGGSNYPDNIVITCPNCNAQKADKTPAEYIAYLCMLDNYTSGRE